MSCQFHGSAVGARSSETARADRLTHWPRTSATMFASSAVKFGSVPSCAWSFSSSLNVRLDFPPPAIGVACPASAPSPGNAMEFGVDSRIERSQSSDDWPEGVRDIWEKESLLDGVRGSLAAGGAGRRVWREMYRRGRKKLRPQTQN